MSGDLPFRTPTPAPSDVADPRPEWVDETRGRCRICRSWRKVTKGGVLVRHKRQDPKRWHMVPCDGGGKPPATETPGSAAGVTP